MKDKINALVKSKWGLAAAGTAFVALVATGNLSPTSTEGAAAGAAIVAALTAFVVAKVAEKRNADQEAPKGPEA